MSQISRDVHGFPNHPKYMEGYDDGVWAQTFPDDFPPDEQKMQDPNYKAGWEQGFADSADVA